MKNFEQHLAELKKKRNSVKYLTTSVGSMCKVAFWVGGVMFKALPLK